MADNSNENEQRFERSEDEPMIVAVVRAIAAVEDIDPLELPRLYDKVPVGIIDELEDVEGDVTVTFSCRDLSITVYDNGECVIRELE